MGRGLHAMPHEMTMSQAEFDSHARLKKSTVIVKDDKEYKLGQKLIIREKGTRRKMMMTINRITKSEDLGVQSGQLVLDTNIDIVSIVNPKQA